MTRVSILAVAGALLLPGAATPAAAEPTPALPFFSKPFPTGYAEREPPCFERHLLRTAHGWRYRTVYVCGPVLHVRD